jgi:hypothetical protein
MRIVITDKAKKYLEKKGEKVLTIDLLIAGCCLEIAEPIAKFGPPSNDQHKFDLFEEEDYKVHFLRGIDAKDNCLTITLNKFFGIEALEVKGIKLL